MNRLFPTSCATRAGQAYKKFGANFPAGIGSSPHGQIRTRHGLDAVGALKTSDPMSMFSRQWPRRADVNPQNQ